MINTFLNTLTQNNTLGLIIIWCGVGLFSIFLLISVVCTIWSIKDNDNLISVIGGIFISLLAIACIVVFSFLGINNITSNVIGVNKI